MRSPLAAMALATSLAGLSPSALPAQLVEVIGTRATAARADASPAGIGVLVRLGQDLSEDDLFSAWLAADTPVVVIQGIAFLPAEQCRMPRDVGGAGENRNVGGAGEDRNVGGAGEARNVGGAGEDRTVGGAGENRTVGGAGENRTVGGAGENRTVGGAGENRTVGGAGEDRTVGGAGQVYQCQILPDRSGFRLIEVTAPDVKYYDGFALIPVVDGVVKY